MTHLRIVLEGRTALSIIGEHPLCSRSPVWMQETAKSWCVLATMGLVLFVAGCGQDPGRVRANQGEVVGSCVAKFRTGQERLELKEDYTYVQVFVSEKRSINHTGRWKLEDHFLDGSDIVLMSVVVSEDDQEGAAEQIGDRIFNVHRRSGRLALALNEPADWYFVRVP